MPDNETMLAEFKRAREMFGEDRVKMLGETESATQKINKRINQFSCFPEAWITRISDKIPEEEAPRPEPTDIKAVIESDYLAEGLTKTEYLIDCLDEINTRLEKLENLVKEIQYAGPRFGG